MAERKGRAFVTAPLRTLAAETVSAMAGRSLFAIKGLVAVSIDEVSKDSLEVVGCNQGYCWDEYHEVSRDRRAVAVCNQETCCGECR